MTTDNPILPYFSVKPTSIALYYQKAFPASNFRGGDLIRKKPRNNNPHRTISGKASKRLKLAVNWLIELAEWKRVWHEQKEVWFSFKVNFITLTLPSYQMHLDTTIKNKAFNSFLTYLRKYYSLQNYVWRCEAQENGNIHFHIVTDTYINYKSIRKAWNNQLRGLGYITRYQKKFKGLKFKEYLQIVDPTGKKDLSKILSAYKYGEKTNWLDPNTTDIHSLQNIENVPAYIAKYLSKNESKVEKDGRYSLKARRIKGRNWGLSQSLSKLKGYTDIRNEAIERLVEYCENLPGVQVVVEDWYKVIFVKFKDWKNKFKNLYKQILKEMIQAAEYVKGGYSHKKIAIS